VIVKDCTKCSLCETRTNIVNGKGNKSADFMLVGEAPGRDEDLCGTPFVGASGALISVALEKLSITKDDIYISNIVKCRPPKNRDPNDYEINVCLPYLMYEIMEVSPKIICLLGRVASKIFIPTLRAITKEEGNIHKILNDISVIPICHPSYYIRGYAPKERFFSNINKAYEMSLFN
jgi:DNA polymerase